MKKKTKIILVVTFLLILIASGFIYYAFFNKKTEPEATNETKVTNQIDDYGYTLEDRDTELFKSKFEELKLLLNTENYDQQEYIKLVSELFIIDLYTIDNKLSRYDIGGLEYVYPDAVSSFKTVVQNSIYKTVENNVDGSRTQKLPELSDITVSDINEITYNMPDKTKVNGYKVTLNWEYKEDLGYDRKGVLVLIPSDKKMAVVYFNHK